mmetsp:Transcript_7373/g.27790  ORF Transcript_7373/g.27790 Transcript_7373/m.27790 type:complete len:248 (+) Transcript_7373:1069-1812(+)
MRRVRHGDVPGEAEAENSVPKDDRGALGGWRLGPAGAVRGGGVHRGYLGGVRTRVPARRCDPRCGATRDVALTRRPPGAVSISRRGDVVRRDVVPTPVASRTRVLPRRGTGSLFADSHVSENDGQSGGPDVHANCTDGLRSAGQAGELDGAPPFVFRPGVAVAELGAREGPGKRSPAARVLQIRGGQVAAVVFPKTGVRFASGKSSESANARLRRPLLHERRVTWFERSVAGKGYQEWDLRKRRRTD